MFELDHIRRCIADYEPRRLPYPANPRKLAAVAMIMAGPPADLSLCFIRRAERAGDNWSGQMAFPGGRASNDDPNATEVARRETLEEVGLHLDNHQLVGGLDDAPIHARNIETDSVLSPFVFYVGANRPALVPEPSEVAAALWIPMRHLWDPNNGTTLEIRQDDVTRTFPGIRYQDDVVWGLTLLLLMSFGEVVGRDLPIINTSDWSERIGEK